MHEDTIAKLAAIADPARFERIATSVLRASNPARYASLSHPGVNAEGKTVKGPFDNFGWVSGPEGPGLVGAAHTTEEAQRIKGKWLHDPSTVTPRKKGAKPTQPAGDLFKAIQEIEQTRKTHPGVKAFYALTSNREEPSEARIDAETLAAAHEVVLDVWSGSRLAQFLDINPDGQAIRREYLGTPVTRMSLPELLRIGHESVNVGPRPVEEDLLVSRNWPAITGHTLISGASGMGKSTFCRYVLQEALKRGKPAIILDDQTVAEALSIEEALTIELRRFSPSLESDAGTRALQLCSESEPLLVAVEDISGSNNPGKLLRKLLAWTARTSESVVPGWRLLCPIWTQLLAEIEPADASKQSAVVRPMGGYSASEANEAVKRRAARSGRPIEPLTAGEIARSLGNDPLLIGLYDVEEATAPTNVIAKYVERQLDRLALEGFFTVTDLQEALRSVCRAMLERGNLQPTWLELKQWLGEGGHLQALRQIVTDANVFRLQKQTKGEILHARHDRVLNELLAQAVARELADRVEPTPFLLDPYYSEVVGTAAARQALPLHCLRAMTNANPLVACYALKHAVAANSAYQTVAAAAIKDWVETAQHRESSFSHRRLWALSVLGEIDSPLILELTSHFPDDRSHLFFKARLRNGDAIAGFNWLCEHPLSVRVEGRREIIDFALKRFHPDILKTTQAALESQELTNAQKLGPLRLAGYLADPALAGFVRSAWMTGGADRDLETYLWAAAHTCGDDAQGLLAPICDVWAGLPYSDRPDEQSPRDSVAEHGLAWRFAEQAPRAGLRYFVARAKSSKELNWAITVMLRAVDDPTAVQLVAESLAERVRDFGEGLGFVSHFLDEWNGSKRAGGRVMSSATKRRLLEMSADLNNYEQLRRVAFRLWEASIAPGDVEVARTIAADDIRYDTAIWGRARRDDLTVIPTLITKIREKPWYWWFSGRYIWTDALTEELGNSLRRIAQAHGAEKNKDDHWIITEHLLRLEPAVAQRLLVPLWDGLQSVGKFVQLALCTDAPVLRSLAQETIRGTADPRQLFEHFATNVGLRVQGGWHPIQVEQLQPLAPYLDFLNDRDLIQLYNFCAQRRWRQFATVYLEPILTRRGDSDDIRRFGWRRSIVTTGELDADLKEGRIWRTLHWFEVHVRQGASREELLSALFTWFRDTSTAMAAEIVYQVLAREGNREDVARFDTLVSGIPGTTAIGDALKFEIFRRTLS